MDRPGYPSKPDGSSDYLPKLAPEANVYSFDSGLSPAVPDSSDERTLREEGGGPSTPSPCPIRAPVSSDVMRKRLGLSGKLRGAGGPSSSGIVGEGSQNLVRG